MEPARHAHTSNHRRESKHLDVIIIGGCGYVGSHIADAFIEKGDTVDVVDVDTSLSNGQNWWAREGLKPPRNISWSNVSSSGLLWENTYDIIVNAACKSLPFGLESPIQCFQDNVNTLLTIIAILNANPSKAGKLLHISSAEANHPSTFYGAAKASCDLIVNAAAKQLKLNVDIETYKPTNVYGTRQLHPAIIPNTIIHWLEGNPIRINGSLDIRRDFVWAPDLGRDIARCAREGGSAGNIPIWSASIGEILGALRAAGLDGEVEIWEPRAGDYTIEKRYSSPDEVFVEHCRELIRWYEEWKRN